MHTMDFGIRETRVQILVLLFLVATGNLLYLCEPQFTSL